MPGKAGLAGPVPRCAGKQMRSFSAGSMKIIGMSLRGSAGFKGDLAVVDVTYKLLAITATHHDQ